MEGLLVLLALAIIVGVAISRSHWHDWSRYGDPRFISVSERVGGLEVRKGEAKVQTRTCKTCGLIQTEYVGRVK